jgi:hypothetical protein
MVRAATSKTSWSSLCRQMRHLMRRFQGSRTCLVPTRTRSIEVRAWRLSRSFRRQRSSVCSWRQLQVVGELGRDSAGWKGRPSVLGFPSEETPFHGKVLLLGILFGDASESGGVSVKIFYIPEFPYQSCIQRHFGWSIYGGVIYLWGPLATVYSHLSHEVIARIPVRRVRVGE